MKSLLDTLGQDKTFVNVYKGVQINMHFVSPMAFNRLVTNCSKHLCNQNSPEVWSEVLEI